MGDNQPQECKICFSESPDAECAYCGELFHKDCAINQLIEEKRCPFCHKELSIIDLRPLISRSHLLHIFELALIENENLLIRQIRPIISNLQNLHRWIQKHHFRLEIARDIISKYPSSKEKSKIVKDVLGKASSLAPFISDSNVKLELLEFNSSHPYVEIMDSRDFLLWSLRNCRDIWSFKLTDSIGRCECGGVIVVQKVKNSTPTCENCGSLFCEDCGAKLSPLTRHSCDLEAKKSHKLLLKKTKPCPVCGTRIEKSIGCDDMFCVICHTGFNWRTNEIIKGQFHNPERNKFFSSSTSLEIIDVIDDDDLFSNSSNIPLFNSLYLINSEFNSCANGTNKLEHDLKLLIAKNLILDIKAHDLFVRFTFAKLIRDFVRSKTRNIRLIMFALQTNSTYKCNWPVIQSELLYAISEINLLASDLRLPPLLRNLPPLIRSLHTFKATPSF